MSKAPTATRGKAKHSRTKAWVNVNLRVPSDIVAAIDRFSRKHGATRSNTIRMAVTKGMTALGKLD